MSINLFFKEKNTNNSSLNFDFDPELVFFETNQGSAMAIRVASGDENNIHKNIIVDLTGIKETSLKLEGFDGVNLDNNKLVTEGVCSLNLVDNQGEQKLVELCKNKIAIIENKKNKIDPTMIDHTQVKNQINAIWQDVFSEASINFMQSGEHLKKHKRNSNRISKTSIFSIALIVISIALLGYTFLIKKNQVQSNGEQTIAEIDPTKMQSDQSANMSNTDNQDTYSPQDEADKDAMKEFGLQEGIDLTKN